MADPDKIPETQSDTQATYDPTVEDVAQQSENLSTSLLSESQDFHLIDCGETPKDTQDEISSNAIKDAEKLVEIRADSTNVSSPQKNKNIEAKLPIEGTNEEIGEISKNKNIEEASVEEKNVPVEIEKQEDENLQIDNDNNEKDVDPKEKDNKIIDEEEDDDNDDFVPSSQVEIMSPLKRQISNLAIVASQKRKADNIDDDILAKFPRTCSQDDALSNVRKRLDDDNVFTIENNTERSDDDIITSMIIQETQESQENMESSESIQQIEQELVEALSQHPIEEDDRKIRDNEKIDSSNVIEEETTATTTTKDIERFVEEKESSDKENPEEEEEKSNVIEQIIPKVSEEPMEISVDSTTKDVTMEESTEEIAKISEKSTINDDTKEKSAKEVEDSPIMPKNDEDVEKKDSPKNNDTCFVAPKTTSRSRMSIEVIYDRSTATPEKKPPRELVEIDEDGEKIILDSSQESCDKTLEKTTDNEKIIDTSYKTCASTDYKSIETAKDSSDDYKTVHTMTNGSTETRIPDSDVTTTERSDLMTIDSSNEKKQSQSPSKKILRVSAAKISENPEILSISDSEESFIVEERTKNKAQISTSLNNDSTTMIKTVPIERDLSILVKLKCLVYVDETTKEQVEKIVTSVNCESAGSVADFSTSRHRNSDNSANLADISGNDKDASPGSVTSIIHPYPLNPRLSMASTSSVSSAGSLNTKIISTGIKFQLPRGPPVKQMKKMFINDSTSMETKRLETDDILEQIKKEWKNIDTVTCAIMNFANQELSNTDQHNGSAIRVDNSLEIIRSSTPEVIQSETKILQSTTPKRATKRSRISTTVNVTRESTDVVGKTTRAKNHRSSESNGVAKDSTIMAIDVNKNTPSTSKKRESTQNVTLTPSRKSTTTKDHNNDETNNEDDDPEELLGKQVFAKWSDNKYYPGTVIGKTKTKFRVNFYDGQNKLIIQDFIVKMPITLNPGLSVYATTDEDDYGSCGIILDVKKLRDSVLYIIETDESEKIEVDIKNIFLTNDQVQVLKEETKIEMKSPPSTPKHLGKISLDNVIDGKRRSKRVLTPMATTPKSKRGRGSLNDKMIDLSKPSSSGISVSTSIKFDDTTTSDSTASGNDDSTEIMIGLQEEIIGTPNEHETKGHSGVIKGKGVRGRKKSETPEIIANLGPMPGQNSDLFKGMSFILSCASLNDIERYQERESSKETRDSNSEAGTENEEEWSRKPFVRERLMAQLIGGGGKIYENFESIPVDEYKNTKHITNVPNTTRKSLLCLSVGIKPYNHQWVIRSCQQNRIVNPSEEELPAGWSLLKKVYVEMFQRRNEKPFQTLPVIVVIPITTSNTEFVSFWKQICENAGGAVLLVENPDDEFIEGTVVLTNKHCPSWVIEKASSWNIPLVSTVWIIECLIEGNICSYDAHPTFKYNYLKRSSSHISHLKRR